MLVRKWPEHRESRYNRALMLAQVQRHHEAIRDYDHLLSVGCGALTASTRFSKALSNLTLGNLREGFVDFEYRRLEVYPPRIDWDGTSSLLGRRVLVTAEMGYGDTIMFSRYLPMLRDLGAEVAVLVPPALNRLVAAITEIAALSVPDHALQWGCNVQIRLMSLARAFGTDILTVPSPAPFVLPQTVKSEGFRVGLCWSGGTKLANDVNRNVPLGLLEPLIAVPGVEFHALNPDVRESDREAFLEFGLRSTAGDFLDTAAAISGLDLVVTVDTAVAHLAASLGIPTWIMLPWFRTYWLWLMQPNPWYPSARCFRQPGHGDWPSVVAQVMSELHRWMLTQQSEKT